MSMREYNINGMGLNITSELLDLYVRDYNNLSEFNKDSKEYQFLHDLGLEECTDEYAKRDVVIEALNDYNVYGVSESTFDFISVDTETGKFNQSSPSDCYYYCFVMHTWNAFKPMFESKQDILKAIEEVLPYVPKDYEWEKYFGWIEGVEWG